MQAPVTWATGLAVLAPDGLPAPLSPRARADVAALAAQLPLGLSRAWYLEVRLDGGSDQVDVSVAIEPETRGHWVRWLATAAATSPFAAPVDAARLVPLLDAWRRGAAATAPVHSIWLELDRPADVTPAPSLFVGLDPEGDPAGDALLALLAQLAPGGDGQTHARVAHLLATRPAGVRVGQLGVMHSRPGAPVRLCLRGLTGATLAGALETWGAGEPPAALFEAVAAMHSAPPLGYVHLDVDAQGVHLAGTEWPCERRAQARGTLQELPWLRALAAAGSVTDAWVDALARWPGGRRLAMPHEWWPSLALRRLNHVKLVPGGAGRPLAKGYCLLRYDVAPARRARAERDVRLTPAVSPALHPTLQRVPA